MRGIRELQGLGNNQELLVYGPLFGLRILALVPVVMRPAKNHDNCLAKSHVDRHFLGVVVTPIRTHGLLFVGFTALFPIFLVAKGRIEPRLEPSQTSGLISGLVRSDAT